jgi:hypothetical protein
MDQLSRAILTAVHPNDDQTIHDTGADASFHEDRDWCYTVLIGALTQSHEWFQRLTCDGHVDRCISLVEVCLGSSPGFNLRHLVTLLRIKSSGKNLPFSPTEERWRLFIADTWDYAILLPFNDNDADMLLALVTATRLNFTALDDGIPREWLAGLAEKVDQFLKKGRRPFESFNIAEAKIDATLSSMQDLHTELSHMIKQRNTLQKDNGA